MKTEKFDDKFWHERLADPQSRSKTFDMLVRKMSPQVYWQIRRLVFSHDDANDIMQNAFLKAWTNIDSFRGDSKVSTWIFRIAINAALSFLQRVQEDSPVYRMEVQSDRRTLFAKVKPYLYLAAMFCGLYFGINVIKHRQDIAKTAKVENAAAVKNANSEDVYIEEVCEYAGIDKEHIYAYATGQDYDY